MKLLKTTFFSSIITFIRIATGFIASKVVALITGAPGIALVGAFTNFIAIVLTLSNGAINTGVVKYTAEYQNDESALKQLFSTSLKISLTCSVIVGIVLCLGSRFFSNYVFLSEVYSNTIVVLGLTIVLYSLNTLLTSILNGRGQIKKLTIVNTAGSIIGLIFTVLLVYFYKIVGALYALVLAQSVVFFITAGLIIKSDWFSWTFFSQRLSKTVVANLSHYSLMAIVSAIVIPGQQIILRNMVISRLGINAAGYWQGVMRISDGYLNLVITSLGIYYLPKLSSLKTDSEYRSEVLNGYKIFLPFVLLGCIIIYYSRFFIIRILYRPDFYAMDPLFIWQLVGDFFKMAAWILAYLMIAKAMTKTFILAELAFSASYVILGFLLVKVFGLKGITMAFGINYILYFLLMVAIFRKMFFNVKSDRT